MSKGKIRVIPRKGILSIPLYVGGKGGLDQFDNPIKLSANENPYGPSKKAIEAFSQAQHNLGIYPDSNHTVLRSNIADVNGIDPERIICGAGSDELIHFLCQCYASKGDEILHTAHGFAMYRISALTVGATPVAIPEVERTADIPSIIKACNERTKIIFLANPNNPTGTLVDSAKIEELANKIPEHILLVLDGAYAEYIEKFDGGIALVEKKSNVFMIRTFSKIYGLGSLRVGWGFGPKHVVEVLRRVKGPFNISSVGQQVAAVAIKDTEYVDKCRNDNFELRRQLAEALREISIASDRSFTNFLLLRFPNTNLAKLADLFLIKKGIIVRNVSNYGLNNCLRVSVGTSSDCEKLIENLTEFQEINHAI